MRPSGFRIRDSGHAHLGAIRDCRFQISERQGPARLWCVGADDYATWGQFEIADSRFQRGTSPQDSGAWGQTTAPPGGDSRLQIPDFREARARRTLARRGRRLRHLEAIRERRFQISERQGPARLWCAGAGATRHLLSSDSWLLTPAFRALASSNEPAHFSLAIRFSFAYNANHSCPRDR